MRNTRFNAAMLPIVALLLCLPLMVASRFSAVGQGLLYVGLAASFMLPFSVYGSTFSIIQKSAPLALRSTVIGVMMMSLNIFALSLGTLFAGWLSDRLASTGSATPLTWVMLIFDGLTALALIGYIGAARMLPKSQRV
jgi:MFS family permease